MLEPLSGRQLDIKSGRCVKEHGIAIGNTNGSCLEDVTHTKQSDARATDNQVDGLLKHFTAVTQICPQGD